MSQPDRPTDTVDATRNKIIEGAGRCFTRYGVAKTTIDDVASAVSMSRRTVYRYFANRNELFAAVISHELEAMSVEGRKIYEASPFGEAFIEVALLMTRRVSESPALARMFAADAKGETFELLFSGREFTALVERFLAPFLRRAQERGEFRTDIGISDATEWITHLIFSLLGPNPVISQHDDDHVRFLLRTFVLPGLAAGGAPPAEAKPAAPAGKTAKPPAKTARRPRTPASQAPARQRA